MNFFGVGALEILIIFVIMLVVAGPKRMVQWAYYIGQYMSKLRGMWGELMESVQKELDEAGVDIKVPKDIPTRSDINRLANEAMKPLQAPMEKAVNEYRSELKDVEGAVKSVRDDTNNTIKPSEWLTGPTESGSKPADDANQKTDNGSGTTKGDQSSFGTWSDAGKTTKQE
jgi:Sec-independent protein translocase protein TatA